jgi:hypothetical protein
VAERTEASQLTSAIDTNVRDVALRDDPPLGPCEWSATWVLDETATYLGSGIADILAEIYMQEDVAGADVPVAGLVRDLVFRERSPVRGEGDHTRDTEG